MLYLMDKNIKLQQQVGVFPLFGRPPKIFVEGNYTKEQNGSDED